MNFLKKIFSNDKVNNEGRLICIQCQNDDLSELNVNSKEGNNSFEPVFNMGGHPVCIYHGKLHESQTMFVKFGNKEARNKYFHHEDFVLKKLGFGKYAGQGNSVSSQSEVLSRMKELKSEIS
jgi:hypothetical protein